METERLNQFKADVESMKMKTGRASRESALQSLSAMSMVVGIAVAVVGYTSSLNTDVSIKGQLDSSSYLTLAVIGLAITVAGTGMFIRYSLAKFLRFWLLRQSYENQVNIERLVDKRSSPLGGFAQPEVLPNTRRGAKPPVVSSR